jgi:flagellar biosynthesis protein FlhF
MQVKKFEARSMKEALEMIKTQLGPDAIILSAKETTKNYGLGGEKSIEITAAYSEAILHKKKFVESKFAPKDVETFQKTSAKNQKVVMQKMIEAQVTKMNAQTTRNHIPTAAVIQSHEPYKMTQRKYIDIDNDQALNSQAQTRVQTTLSSTTATTTPSAAVTQIAQKSWNDMEVNSLKKEIESLKQVMTSFKTMPQSFVHAHPGAELGIHYALSAQFQKLTARGLLPEIAADILLQAQKKMTPEQMQNRHNMESWTAKYMMDTIPIVSEGFEQFHLFVGPSGSGKTSSLIKMASDLILNQRKRVAIITTDTSKVGAVEQMKIFSQILNVPYLSIKCQQDWAHVIPHLDQIDHILVDYSGLNLRNQEEFNYLKRMSPPVFQSMRTHLVLSAMSKDSDLFDLAKRYQVFGFDDVIFTSLDEASLHGNIYNFVRKNSTSLYAFGIGQKVPEDFERATAERVVDLILQITQNQNQSQTQDPQI